MAVDIVVMPVEDAVDGLWGDAFGCGVHRGVIYLVNN